MGLIGETVDENDEICGARIVNKTVAKGVSYKIEVWLRSRNEEISSRIRTRVLDALTDGEASKTGGRGIPEFLYKVHGN